MHAMRFNTPIAACSGSPVLAPKQGQQHDDAVHYDPDAHTLQRSNHPGIGAHGLDPRRHMKGHQRQPSAMPLPGIAPVAASGGMRRSPLAPHARPGRDVGRESSRESVSARAVPWRRGMGGVG